MLKEVKETWLEGSRVQSRERRMETQQAETSWVKWPAADDERLVANRLECQRNEWDGLESCWAGHVETNVSQVSGKRRETAGESKDKKGQRLDSFLFFFLNKRQWATLRVGFVWLCSYFPFPKVTEVKQQFASSPFRRSCISPCRRESERLFEECCRR